MLLRELRDEGLIQLVEGPLDWRDALRASVAPLVAAGAATERYGDELVRNVEKYGPYIVLLPGVAMPHAMERAEGALRSAVALTRVSEPVHFGSPDDPSKDAALLFTLCDCDAEAHLANMQRLYGVLTNDEALARLAAMESLDEIDDIDALISP